MSSRTLGAVQVAGLLVSASYGIGFLFGSGEMAIRHGMGGGIYGVATAIGMLLLATLAPWLWRRNRPIWDLIGEAYGSSLRDKVALLSVLWMAGVLAAQIQGGVATLGLLGLSSIASYGMVLATIFLMSRLVLHAASKWFGMALLLSAGVLVAATFTGPAKEAYLASPALVVASVGTFDAWPLATMCVATIALVCMGGDYHQFLVAGKTSKCATWGCILAALILALISTMPPAVVVGAQGARGFQAPQDAKQVIPFALTQLAQSWNAGSARWLLAALSAAAVGSAGAILRAMTCALKVMMPDRSTATPARAGVLALAFGTALAAQGHGIVETMVSMNVTFIASVSLVFCSILFGRPMLPGQARTAMLLGLAGSIVGHIASFGSPSDALSLCVGLGASLLALVGHWPGSIWRQLRSERRAD